MTYTIYQQNLSNNGFSRRHAVATASNEREARTIMQQLTERTRRRTLHDDSALFFCPQLADDGSDELPF
jgi:hypothetical protein